MPKFMRKMAILAKPEATRGVDSVPTGAANALLVSAVTLTPIEGDTVERDNIKPYFGGAGSALVTAYSKIAFSVEMAGVAVAGALPGYSALLRGCGMSATTLNAVSVTYAPVSDALESLTIYGNVDGNLHKMTDAHGTVKATVDAKGIPKWQFEFTGLFLPVSAAGLPVVDYVAFLDPLGVNKINTTLSLDGYAAAASSFAFDLGLTVVKRDLINVDSVEITGRKTTASVTMENTSAAVKDWVGMARASAKVAFALKHGQGATNVVEITAARAQVGKPTYSDSDGIQMVTIPLEFIPSAAGNDEVAIIVR